MCAGRQHHYHRPLVNLSQHVLMTLMLSKNGYDLLTNGCRFISRWRWQCRYPRTNTTKKHTCIWNMDMLSSSICTLTASILPPFFGVAGGVREPPPAPSTPAGVLAEWCIRPAGEKMVWRPYFLHTTWHYKKVYSAEEHVDCGACTLGSL